MKIEFDKSYDKHFSVTDIGKDGNSQQKRQAGCY